MSVEEARIAATIEDGDYFEALDVRPTSTMTDIAVAAARLASEHPRHARRINAIASLLRDPRQREIYLIARAERDNVLRRALEPRLNEAVPNLRRRVWTELQRLLRCEFELGEVKVGPRAARSLARRHEWIREAVVNSAFPVLAPSQFERRAGAAHRILNFTRECAKCGGLAPEECDCADLYSFDIPSGAAPGTLLGSYGERTGRYHCVILDRPVLAPRPYAAIGLIYMAYRAGPRLGSKADLTVEEARVWLRQQYVGFGIGFAVLGAVVGLLLSSWLTGVLAALAGFAPLATRFYATSRRRSLALLEVGLVVPPVTGALAGSALATATGGLLTGLTLSAGVAALTVFARRRPT